MNEKKRKQHSAEYKFQVALEAAKQTKTINQIASEQGLHPNQVSEWKRQLMEDGASLYQRSKVQGARPAEAEQTELYEQIGRLKMELEWLKKKVARIN